MKVEFIPKPHIEAAASGLLGRYGQRFGEITEGPVPVEEILESLLGLDLEFDDLVRLTGITDVLGATWIGDRRVVVHESLDPTEHPEREGRYRFTLAHELGHWELHRSYFEETPGQLSLFGGPPPPSIVCRTATRKEPMEWQADSFAGYLLMPEPLVLAEWVRLTGSPQAAQAEQEIAELKTRFGLAEGQVPTVQAAKQMAERLKVSGQAMMIRLVDLGLIRTEKPEPSLFDT